MFWAKYKNVLLIIATILVSSLILYLPFLLHASHWFGLSIKDSNFLYIYRNFDGPLYIIPAKTWYDPQLISNLQLELPLPVQYFAAHLPVYPLFIALFAPVLGFLKSMIFVNLLFTVLLAVFFYHFLKTFKLSSNPLVITIIFLFLPRFLVIRSVGAPESIFLLFILASVFFFEKEQYIWAGIFGALSVATKIPGILLFVAYFFVFLEKYLRYRRFDPRWLSILIIPIGLIGVFVLYARQYHDFFAFFHTGGVVPLLFPFSGFNFQSKWVGTGWLEENLFYFFMYFLAVINLKDVKYRSFFYFSLIFITATTFVQHQDIARYALPVWPFAVIAFEKFFLSKKFQLATLLLLPGVYLYAWNFLVYNIMPIANWRPYL